MYLLAICMSSSAKKNLYSEILFIFESDWLFVIKLYEFFIYFEY